jgi:hypothetical protein
VSLEPAASEWAHRDDREPIADRPLDGRAHEAPSDALAFELLGNLGVDEREAITLEVVDELGEAAVDLELEPTFGLVVDDG